MGDKSPAGPSKHPEERGLVDADTTQPGESWELRIMAMRHTELAAEGQDTQFHNGQQERRPSENPE